MIAGHQSNREALEELKIKMDQIESDIKMHENEIARLNTEKALVRKSMAELLDTKTEERLLTAVYEQRMKLRQ